MQAQYKGRLLESKEAQLLPPSAGTGCPSQEGVSGRGTQQLAGIVQIS